ncbi:MAG: cell division protein ZapD [Parasutterella sp.]
MTETLLRYEFPSNEKLRTFLRLADLFKQLTWFAQQENANDHRAAIIKYFEIQEVTTRGDQKNDLLHELARFRSCLEPLANNDNVDQESLKETLDKLQASRAELSCVGVRISHLSSQNEFLKTVGQRSGIPAGTCEFDVPVYHHWLHLSAEERKHYLNEWIKPLLPYSNAIDLILNLLRGTAELNDVEAIKGSYQKDLQGKTFTLLQVFVDPKLNMIPKISANRYLLSVRFSAPISAAVRSRNSRGDAFPPRFMQYVVKWQLKLNAPPAGVNVNTQTRTRIVLSAANVAA